MIRTVARREAGTSLSKVKHFLCIIFREHPQGVQGRAQDDIFLFCRQKMAVSMTLWGTTLASGSLHFLTHGDSPSVSALGPEPYRDDV